MNAKYLVKISLHEQVVQNWLYIVIPLSTAQVRVIMMNIRRLYDRNVFACTMNLADSSKPKHYAILHGFVPERAKDSGTIQLSNCQLEDSGYVFNIVCVSCLVRPLSTCHHSLMNVC